MGGCGDLTCSFGSSRGVDRGLEGVFWTSGSALRGPSYNRCHLGLLDTPDTPDITLREEVISRLGVWLSF